MDAAMSTAKRAQAIHDDGYLRALREVRDMVAAHPLSSMELMIERDRVLNGIDAMITKEEGQTSRGERLYSIKGKPVREVKEARNAPVVDSGTERAPTIEECIQWAAQGYSRMTADLNELEAETLRILRAVKEQRMNIDQCDAVGIGMSSCDGCEGGR
jgi:hypothetical protein